MTSGTLIRPAPPRKATSLIVPLLVIISGFALGAAIPDPVFGLVGGLLAAVGLVLGLHLASIEVSNTERVLLVGGVVVSFVLGSIAFGRAVVTVTPSAALASGLIWLTTGVASGAVTGRRRGPSSGINVTLMWAGGGVLAVPIADILGLLEVGIEPTLTTSILIAALVALVGGGVTLSAVTGVRGVGIGAVIIAITWLAAAQVGFSLIGLIENIAGITQVPNFWPPDFGWAIGKADWWWLPDWEFGSATRDSPIIETFRIAIISSLIGCGVALPVAFMASTITTPNRLSYLLNKGFMNVIRTIPDLFWAMLFVAAVGGGPLAGVLALFFFSLAIMSKLLSETVDSVDPGPLEAARATGGSHFPAVRASVLPQVLPNYVAYGLYIFELNIRASAVLGLVGAGGIGRVIEAQRVFFRFDRVLAVVIVIFVIVFVIEQVSVAIRRRLV